MSHYNYEKNRPIFPLFLLFCIWCTKNIASHGMVSKKGHTTAIIQLGILELMSVFFARTVAAAVLLLLRYCCIAVFHLAFSFLYQTKNIEGHAFIMPF